MNEGGGFVTRVEASKVSKSVRRPHRGAISGSLAKMGAAAAEGMNPNAANPNLQPCGPENPEVYILGSFPGSASDIRGKHFEGKSGKLLKSAIPSDKRSKVTYDYIVRTRPPGGRPPTNQEIEVFRGEVIRSIEKAKPKVVVALGAAPFVWAMDERPSTVKAARGKLAVARFGKHVCHLLTAMDPVHLVIMNERERRGEDRVPYSEWERTFYEDIERAFDTDDLEPAQVEVEDLSGVKPCLTVTSVRKAVRSLLKCEEIGWDWETNGFRPYKEGAKILTAAFSDGETTYTIPVDHSQAPWTPEERAEVMDLIGSLFTPDGPRLVAHNLPFEIEWLLYFWGEKALRGKFGCSLQAAFVLDPGPPGEKGSAGHSLDFLCKTRFGLHLKSLSPAATMVARLDEVKLDKVLNYNALDAKWCLRLWWAIMDDIIENDLADGYRVQMKRIIPIVRTQALGVPVDASVTKVFDEALSADLKTAHDEMMADDAVVEFVADNGKLNLRSSNAISKFVEYHGLAKYLPRTDSGAISTKAAALRGVLSRLPVLEKLLSYREVDKLKGTYVDRFMPGARDGYVYPDGKIHCQFSIARARTGRLSSEHPNNQNWPKRKHAEIRQQLVAPDGHLFLASDQGQIEARVLAMASKDPTWVEMVWDDHDVHAEWSEKLIQVCPELLDRYGDFKGVRAMVKNGWVFPAFYGSSPKSIIYNMDLPEGPATTLFEEFWDTFAGVYSWQEDTWAEYVRTGEVRSLTGRRRLAPLSRNMVINAGIQGTASDITQDACDRLSMKAIREGKPWLQSVMLIHDDITFIVPEDRIDEAIEDVVTEQLGFDAPWVNVPLSVEVATGPNMYDMTDIGTWTSKEGYV